MVSAPLCIKLHAIAPRSDKSSPRLPILNQSRRNPTSGSRREAFLSCSLKGAHQSVLFEPVSKRLIKSVKSSMVTELSPFTSAAIRSSPLSSLVSM